MPGRKNGDSILLAQKLTRGHNRSCMSPTCTLNVDPTKAYDSLAWKSAEVMFCLGWQWILQLLYPCEFPWAKAFDTKGTGESLLLWPWSSFTGHRMRWLCSRMDSGFIPGARSSKFVMCVLLPPSNGSLTGILLGFVGSQRSLWISLLFHVFLQLEEGEVERVTSGGVTLDWNISWLVRSQIKSISLNYRGLIFWYLSIYYYGVGKRSNQWEYLILRTKMLLVTWKSEPQSGGFVECCYIRNKRIEVWWHGSTV